MTETEQDEWAEAMENETSNQTPVTELRDWARGMNPLVAATELLIRNNMAQTWRPWVRERSGGGYWIDFTIIPDCVGGMSGGERRFLLLAASLGAGVGDAVEVALEDLVPGLDAGRVELLLAAIAHAAGLEHLHPWPN